MHIGILLNILHVKEDNDDIKEVCIQIIFPWCVFSHVFLILLLQENLSAKCHI